MIEIPNQLKKEGFKFIKVAKKEKRPIEAKWQSENNYEYNNHILINHIKQGGNYGVLGGYKNLIILDFDDMNLQNILEDKLPKTFTIKTGSGLKHKYYICDKKPDSFKLVDLNNNTLMDIQGNGKQCIGANSIHPNGSKYKVIENIEIAYINYDEVKELLKSYDPKEQSKTNINANSPKYTQYIDFKKELEDNGIDTSKNPTKCLWHDSKGGQCFSFNIEKELWNCFNCGKGGDIFSFYMEHKGCDFKTALYYFAKKYNFQDKIKKSNKKEDNNIIEKSFFKDNNYLYEQIKGNKFIRNDGEIFSEINYKGDKIKPCSGVELTEGCEVVYLPEGISNYGDVNSLVNEIKEFIHKWCDISEEFEVFSAWYVLLSWVYDAVPTINYLSAMGDTGCGKSRFMFTIGLICYKPMVGSGGVSVAAVKRVVNKWKGTLLIDEGDLKASDETADLIKLLNLGFEKGQVMYNCDKNDPSKIEFFDPYCPKLITRRRQFNDQALEARCLTNVMQQTTRKDIKPLLTKDFYKKQLEFRKKLLKFRFDYYDKIDIDASASIDLGNIEPRIKQATLAFTTLMASVPEALESFKVFINDYNKQIIEERAESYDGQIVNAIIHYIENNTLEITAQKIVDHCSNDKITSRSVGKHLKQLGIKTHQKKINGKNLKIVPLSGRLVEVVKRYCTDENKVSIVSKVSLITSTCSHSTNTELSINNKKIEVDVTVDTNGANDTSKKPTFDEIYEKFKAKILSNDFSNQPYDKVVFQDVMDLPEDIFDKCISKAFQEQLMMEHSPSKYLILK